MTLTAQRVTCTNFKLTQSTFVHILWLIAHEQAALNKLNIQN